MKILKLIGLGVGMIGLLSQYPVYAVEVSQAIADHEGLAASYEEKAAAQDALIAEHTQMKKEYKDRFFVNEKVSSPDKIRAMENHCDAIIEAAKEEKGQLLEFAKWHRMSAAELQGQ
jgi:monoamine oxidase